MNNCFAGGLAALLSFGCASMALAQDATAPDPGDTITVENQLLHPAAGLMNEHMHEGGEVMLGLRFQRDRWSGTNVSGTSELSDAEVHAAGYGVRTETMEMDMVMLDLMFAPSDSLTLMVMPHYMWHRMTMLGIDPMAGMAMGSAETGGHATGLAYGATHSHGAEGFGDTLVSASYRLARSPAFNAHATLGVWVPTGKVGLKNPDGTFVHYGMQPGSGTWDIEPSATLSGRIGMVGWGAQGAYRWRSESANASGFAFGDKARVSGWASYLLSGTLGVTTRLEFEHEGVIRNHYNGPHKHMSPPDIQGNYGGDTVSAGLGLNWLLPTATRHRPQLAAEFAVPLYQNLNGIQAPRDWRLSLGVSQTF